MRKFILAIFFLCAAYLAAWMGDYSHSYIANSTSGWGVVTLKDLDAGPGWFGGLIAVLGLIGFASSIILMVRTADPKDDMEEDSFVWHGLWFLVGAYAFGAIFGPFEAWGKSPLEWLNGRPALLAVICVWSIVWEGTLAFLNATAAGISKATANSNSNVSPLKSVPTGQKSA